MAYGIIEYNEEGLPMCEICGEYFNRVIAHARQKHDISEKEYKKQFGFDLKKGICSTASAEKSREKTLQNYDKCIKNNLLDKGSESRFEKGSEGRTKEKVSEQTRLMLKKRLEEDYMKKAMRASGEKVGKTGLGNAKRWNKTSENKILNLEGYITENNEENMKKLDNFDDLIAKYDKIKSLVIELKNSTKYESCDYIVKQYVESRRVYRYLLFDTKTMEELRHGTKEDILSYIRRRNIDPDKIYDYDLIKAQ